MAQYYQIVHNVDELKRMYPDLNVDNLQVVSVQGDDANSQTRTQLLLDDSILLNDGQQVVYQTTNQAQQQQQQQTQSQPTQFILQDDSMHHQQQQQQQQQQQHAQQHIYHQVQQEQRNQLQHQSHQGPQQIYYTSELHQNPTMVQHTSSQQQQHQHAQAQSTHQANQPAQQIVYRMPVPMQPQAQNNQQTQQIINNTHVIVQQSPHQVLIQAPQTIHQQRILYNPNRVMYTHQATTSPQMQQEQQQQQLLQAQDVVNQQQQQQQQQQQHANVTPHQQQIHMQQPRLGPHPRPIVTATQQPSQNVIYHQVQDVQNVPIQQPHGVISPQLRSTIRAKIPRGSMSPRLNVPRATTPMLTQVETQKGAKSRVTTTTGTTRGGRGGRTVRGRAVSASPRTSSVPNAQVSNANNTQSNIPTPPKVLNQSLHQQQQPSPIPQQNQQTQNFKLQTFDFLENSQKFTVPTTNTNVSNSGAQMTPTTTSVQTPVNMRYRNMTQQKTTIPVSESPNATTVNTSNTATSGNYLSNLDLEESIQAVVVKKTQEQQQTTNSSSMATTLTTYYAENENEDARLLKMQNSTCMTLNEYKKRNQSILKTMPMRTTSTTNAAPVTQKLQLSTASSGPSSSSSSLSNVARIAIQQKSLGTSSTGMQNEGTTTAPSVQRTSHNNYEIQTQHVIQNRSIQQIQNCSEKDRNSAKMLVILASGEQRLITFTLPRESCTVQDLLEQVGVPFDDKTTIQCVESPGANIDFVVTVGFSVQESASELISKAEESIQMSRQQESASNVNVSTASTVNSTQRSIQQSTTNTNAASHIPSMNSSPDEGTAKNIPSKLAEDIPEKLIEGFLAVCQHCGFCGWDHAKCDRCKKAFLEEPKRMPSNKNNAPSNQSKLEEDKKRTLPGELLNRAQNKLLTVAPSRGGRTGITLRGRARSGRSRPAEVETVVLTLSSDEEGDDEQSNKSAKKVPVVNAATNPGKPFAFEPDVSEVDDSRVYEDFRRENVAEISNALDNMYTTVTCKLIRIGTHRFETKDPVTFTKKGIRILAPNCSNLSEVVALDIYKEEIVKIVAYFSKSFSVMFIYTMRKCSEYIRETLDMKPKVTALETPYFNSTERGDTYNKIILQIDTISDEATNVIRSIYKSITLEEIQFHDANELLLRAAAKDKYVVNANSNEIRLDPNDIRQILIYPPGKGGISINTEDYMCLATDQYLNDVIIDFYLKWLHNNIIPEKNRDRTYIFSSFFYKRLTTMSTRPRAQSAKDIKLTAAQKRHARVANWTKNVNLFEKDFIIIPINELSHWFLAIICFPMIQGAVTFDTNEPIVQQQVAKKKKVGEKKISLQIGSTTITPLSKREDPVCLGDEDSERDEAEGDDSDLASDDSDFDTSSANGSQRQPIKQPVILIFDSLAGASRSRVVATLRDYLTCEYQAKMQDNTSHVYTKTNMPGNCVKVPQQNNFTDCGLYLLQYVEQFFTDPIRDYTLPIKQLVNWFETIVVTRKREEISLLLTELIREYNPSQLPLPKIPFPTLNGELIERPDENFSEDQVEFEEEEMEEDGLEEEDTAETESSPEEPVRIEKSVASATLTTPALGRKIVLKRSFSGMSGAITVNVRKTPKLDQ